jgi:hypothetical protein
MEERSDSVVDRELVSKYRQLLDRADESKALEQQYDADLRQESFPDEPLSDDERTVLFPDMDWLPAPEPPARD